MTTKSTNKEEKAPAPVDLYSLCIYDLNEIESRLEVLVKVLKNTSPRAGSGESPLITESEACTLARIDLSECVASLRAIIDKLESAV